MPNPLENWKHGKKRRTLDKSELPPAIPLLLEPVYDKDADEWVAIISKRLPNRSQRPPDLTGVVFSWEGQVFEAIHQEIISDPAKLRDLNHRYRHEAGLRVFLKVRMVEADFLLTLKKTL